MNEPPVFKQWIQHLRRDLDLTREALAEQVGCAAQTIRAFELGRRRPSRDLAARLADVLQVPGEQRSHFVRLARMPANVDHGPVGIAEPGWNAGGEPRLPSFGAPSRRTHGERAAATLPAPLIATKLQAPPPRPHAALVARPRLLARLDAALSTQLTLIAAPAGFGKTTLLADWLSRQGRNTEPAPGGHPRISGPRPQNAEVTTTQPAARSPNAVAWLALDAGDSDPVVFARYLIAALQTIVPAAGATVLPLLNTGQSSSIAAVLPLLINDLMALPDRSVLVLDDYHLVDSPAVHQALAFLLDHLPPQLHLVIATRVDPPLPLPRLRVRGQLVELRAHDLRFTADEAATFLQETMGLSLTTDDVAALDARTEGWIAGLQLAALSLQDRVGEQRAAFIAAFTGSHRFVVDYLVDEVLARQPPHLQTFLLQTSVLERLCGQLCDAVIGAGGSYSQPLLAELERSNLFIVPLDDERHWYRYHHLFAQVLRERLMSGTSEAAVAGLHQRASAWFEAQALVVEAVQHALAARDWERAARLIEQHGRFLVVSGQVHTVLAWFKLLPEPALHARPYLYVIHAVGLFFMNELGPAERHLRAAEEHLGAAVQDDRSRGIQGYATILRASIARYRGDLARCVELARQGLEILLPSDKSGRIAANVHVAGAYLLHGDVSPANEHLLADVVADARTTGELNGIFYAIVALAGLQWRQGRLRQAVATYREAGRLVPDPNGLQAFPNGANYYFGLGALLLELNDLDAAADLLARGRATVQSMRLADAESIVLGYTTLARLQQVRGVGGDALATLDELHEVALAREFVPHLLLRAAAVRALLELQRGNLPAAVAWANGSDLRLDDDLSYPREPEYLTLARVLIARGRHDPAGPLLDDALRLLDRLLADAEAGARIDSVIELVILRALALQARGESNAALIALQRALTLGAGEGYVRVFVDEGAPMAALLREALGARGWGLGNASPEHDVRAYAEHLLQLGSSAMPNGAAPAAPLLPPNPQPPTPSPLAEPLTVRELEVLRLLAMGRSNNAIADDLILAVGTVKRHVNSIMGKLDAHSRLEAVAHARELNLV